VEAGFGEIEAGKRVFDREALRERLLKLRNRTILLSQPRLHKGYGVGIIRRPNPQLKPNLRRESARNAMSATDSIAPFRAIARTHRGFVLGWHVIRRAKAGMDVYYGED